MMRDRALQATEVSFTRLDADDTPDLIDTLFPQVIALSHEVFWLASEESRSPSYATSFECEASRRLTEKVWRSRLEHDAGVCYVALAKCPPPSRPHRYGYDSPAKASVCVERPVGFVIAHRARHDASRGPFPSSTVHLWLSGVDPAFRRRRIMAELVKMLTDDVRRAFWGRVRTLSVRTIPNRFGAMVAYLEMDGWDRVEEDDGDDERIAYRKHVPENLP